ncbi:hypothetical protein BDV25DRAFT_25676 [Aspergillus avenaceus]|uniref:Uncharacterized protein n=1 Tax=Aspergillus avenaceus TaxID=36643 RepID=A0A5N6TNM3_ASPAV|nr:hypothetical protein BDV25DRAFT_25676 [Aspergillus avenaceus]
MIQGDSISFIGYICRGGSVYDSFGAVYAGCEMLLPATKTQATIIDYAVILYAPWDGLRNLPREMISTQCYIPSQCGTHCWIWVYAIFGKFFCSFCYLFIMFSLVLHFSKARGVLAEREACSDD